jgi:dextranase
MPGNQNIPITSTLVIDIKTDKAIYFPGETVTFTIDRIVPPGSIIRYRHLLQTIKQVFYSRQTWTWQTPSKDFTGYLVEIYKIEAGREVMNGAIAVDVSSDWKRFPRYGFLSKFPRLSESQMDAVIDILNRHHINGIQFYDWAEKHHKPLAGTVSNPSQIWFDIANRQTYKATVEGYIYKAHQKGIQAMSYNLCYGALNDASDDGVKPEWYLYDDPHHTKMTVFDKGSFLKSPIYLMDPSNPDWQNYLAERNEDFYSIFAFDGFHIDQLGDWGIKYNYNDQPVNVVGGFGSFVQAMKKYHPDKRLIFNAVNQYGQGKIIAGSSVDFLYTEVWNPNENYEDLSHIIRINEKLSNNTKNSILAAHVNYNLADNAGQFNTPGVLFADAVIFVFGGAHLELGEHMLAKEYFPNSNLRMPEDLKKSVIEYYDFLVAYQNLLRDGGTFNNPEIKATDSKVFIKTWPPQTGAVSVIGKSIGNRQILHLINFMTNSLDWRDTNGTKSVPELIYDLKLAYSTNQNVSRVWFASPDLNYGSPIELDFQKNNNHLTFIVPSLRYWDMIMTE